ncbi:hypothetical protein [Streptomyces alfalfae]
MTPLAAALALLAAGYALGRYRPAHRASDWAHWQTYGKQQPRRNVRWWIVFVVLSAENLGWLLLHPVKGWHAWKHRNDPSPPRSPAVRIRSASTAKRRATATTEEA